MRLLATALAVAATLTVGSQAFLIPPNMNKEAINDEEFMLMNVAGGVDPNNRVLKAGCMKCLKDGGDGVLIFDLVISNFDSPKLLINGADLTPLDILHSDPLDLVTLYMPPPSLSVPLVPAGVQLSELATQDLKPKEVKVTYDLFSEIQQLGDGEVVKITIDVTNVDGRAVGYGMSDSLEIRIVREAGRKMVILDASTTSRVGVKDSSDCGVFCSFLAMLHDMGKETGEVVDSWGKKIGSKLRPCGGKTNGADTSVSGHAATTPDIIPDTSSRHRPHYQHEERPHARPWSHHHHHHHHRPHGHGHIMSTVYKVFRQVLVPIAIGIVVGMLVSLTGIVVGHLVVLAYQKVVGSLKKKKAQVGPSSVGKPDEEEGLLSKKEEEYDVPPPEYDGGEAVVDEKQ